MRMGPADRYERHGFRWERMTDGSSNMEREPDALYSWQPGLMARNAIAPER